MEIINKLHFYSFNPAKEVDEKDFRALELIIQRSLPLSYKEFYIANNGGRVKENFFYRNPNDEFEAFIVNDFYHIDSDEENDKYGNNIFTIIKKGIGKIGKNVRFSHGDTMAQIISYILISKIMNLKYMLIFMTRGKKVFYWQIQLKNFF